MNLLDYILHTLKQEFNLNSLDSHIFSDEDLESLQENNPKKVKAIHYCNDDEFAWISEDLDETDDSYECYDLLTLPEEYGYLNIYLYNLI